MNSITVLIIMIAVCNQFFDSRGLNFLYGRQGIKQAKFERFNNTCGGPNQPIFFSYSGMTMRGSLLSLNCTIKVKEDIRNDPRIMVTIERCRTKENLDTCEHFYDYKMDSFCWMTDPHTPLWGAFFGSYDPKFTCPIKKGVYKSVNSTIDTSALLLFPLEAYYWKVKTIQYDPETNNIYMCLLVEAHITTIRVDN